MQMQIILTTLTVTVMMMMIDVKVSMVGEANTAVGMATTAVGVEEGCMGTVAVAAVLVAIESTSAHGMTSFLLRVDALPAGGLVLISY